MFSFFSRAPPRDEGADEGAEATRERAETVVRLALRQAQHVGVVRALSAHDILTTAEVHFALLLPAGTPESEIKEQTRAFFERAASEPRAKAGPYGIVPFPKHDLIGPVAVHMRDIVYDAQSKRYLLVDDAADVAAQLGAAQASFSNGRVSGVLRTLRQRADEHTLLCGIDVLFTVMELAPGECTREEGKEPVLMGAAATVADVCMRLAWSLKIVPRAAPLTGAQEWTLVARLVGQERRAAPAR